MNYTVIWIVFLLFLCIPTTEVYISFSVNSQNTSFRSYFVPPGFHLDLVLRFTVFIKQYGQQINIIVVYQKGVFVYLTAVFFSSILKI